MFFALFGQFSQQFTLPSLRVAAAFAWEVRLPRMHALCEGQLPMAIHAYNKYDPEFFARTIHPRGIVRQLTRCERATRFGSAPCQRPRFLFYTCP